MGLGLQATRKFEDGEFVVEYAGEYIASYEDSEKRRAELVEIGRDSFIYSFQVPGSSGKYNWSVISTSFNPRLG